MGRRRHEEEHENHERWLVSYADFITLLFAFFVVMYAISSVNEGKYRVLSDSLNSAFRDVPGDASGAMAAVVRTSQIRQPIPLPVTKPTAAQDAARTQRREKMSKMASQLRAALGDLEKGGQVHVAEGSFGIAVDINASLLFAPGEARLDTAAVHTLENIGSVLAGSDMPIIVEGHTDNVPISTPQFPSNWELSGMRAASVVRVFVAHGVAPQRLSSVGYADQHPVADNATVEGRQRNRRVAIMIASPDEETAGHTSAP